MNDLKEALFLRRLTAVVFAAALLSALPLSTGHTNAAPLSKTNQDPQAAITQQEAEEIALAKVPGEIVKKEIEIDIRKDTVVFEFEIETASGIVEVTIDGKTGKILVVEKEDKKKD